VVLSGHETGGAYWIVRSGRCSGGIFIAEGFAQLPPSRARCQRFGDYSSPSTQLDSFGGSV